MKALLSAFFTMMVLIGLFCDTNSAAAANTEILTINVNVTLANHTLIGSYVVHRATSGQATWTFNGMFDGKHGTADGTVAEQWNANGTGTLQLLTLHGSAIPFESLPTHTITISAGNSGVFTISGVPFAVKGSILAPGAGNATIFVTNTGQGTRQILSLPNTAGDPPLAPELIVGLLCATGIGLLGVGMHLRRSAHRTAT